MFAFGLIAPYHVAALIGVMFMVVIGTFAWNSFRLLRLVPRADAFVILLVTVVTVYEDLAVAVVVGVIVSALAYVWSNARRIHANTEITKDGAKVYKINGPLFFGSASGFAAQSSFRTVTETVVVQEASTELVSVPAVYGTATETVVVQPESVEYTSIPATYETVQEAVVVQEASTQLVSIPPVYETVSETVVVQEASTELVTVPATYTTVSETVVVQPQSVDYVTVPATYETVTETVVDTTTTELPKIEGKNSYSMYDKRCFPENAADKIEQIRGLARIGAAASDSNMVIDLEDHGYLSLFEVINRLCDEIWREVDDLQLKAKVGTYAHLREPSGNP